uniref:Reverse transcriptase Ty1/copia-type domain-containing protein n=1 Tax=Glossina pallidipes TaxID=7398 RepID=A0A1B0AJ84_GLOPL
MKTYATKIKVSFDDMGNSVASNNNVQNSNQNICDSNEHMKAMKSEYNSLKKYEAWPLIDHPKGKRAVGSEWVLAIKRDRQGNIELFKACLVAEGHGQRSDIHKTCYALKQAARDWNQKDENKRYTISK